ncbi:MAG: GNAT family N-acetyltransferase [Clostridia bacterium]|nr:GNAT family N-acetyltransferase [Clostridia bacterium]
MQMPNLLTDRLILRPTREADGPACLDIWLDDEMGRYLADPPRALADERYLNFAVGIEEDEDWYPMVAIHRETGAFVGTCSVVPTEDGACWDLGYCIHRNYWKQGYATEMVSRLIAEGKCCGVRAFTATVAQENAGSNALCRKLGFRVWKDDGAFRKSKTDIVYKEFLYRLEN